MRLKLVKIHTFHSTGPGGETGMKLKPHPLQHIYSNKLVKAIEQSATPGLTLLESEVKCLLFTDEMVSLSPTKEGIQQHLDLLHRFCQTWALTVNLSKTKIIVFPYPFKHSTSSCVPPLAPGSAHSQMLFFAIIVSLTHTHTI